MAPTTQSWLIGFILGYLAGMIVTHVIRAISLHGAKEFFCWHQWKDFNMRDYPVKVQRCIHCRKWRGKK